MPIANNSLEPSFNHIAGLDGLRAISILSVVIAHFGIAEIIPGGFGVTMFFFISGFLITRLMIAEHHDQNGISLKLFYIRRMLRLYPALLFFILIAVIFYSFVGQKMGMQEILSAIFYMANYFKLFVGYDSFTSDITGWQVGHPFSILWSLAVEEHFYLLFPILFSLFYKTKRSFFILIITLLVTSLLWRYFLVVEWEVESNRTYFATDTRIDSILFGCLFSLLLSLKLRAKLISFAGKPWVFLTGVSLLVFTFLYRDLVFRETLRYSLQGLALMLIFPGLLFAPGYTLIKAFLQSAPMVYIGKLSYSLYLHHWMARTISGYFFKDESVTWTLCCLVLTVILSIISYHYVEKAFIPLRHKFGSHVPIRNYRANNLSALPRDNKS